MDKVVAGKDTAWRKGITVADLLRELNEIRPLVGALVNGTYGSRSRFGEIKIPDQADVEFIPWREGMTVRELLEYQMDQGYICAATIDGLLIPEDRFDKTLIPENAEVWLLPVVGGG